MRFPLASSLITMALHGEVTLSGNLISYNSLSLGIQLTVQVGGDSFKPASPYAFIKAIQDISRVVDVKMRAASATK